jgi:SAM-dependent methyltransferase
MSSLACPVDLDTARLHEAVRDTYAHVAREPGGDFHFHRGPDYAAARLGYDAGELATLPAACTEPFAGVGNPLAIAPLAPGETVLDVGSGAGMDLLLAARRVGPDGRAIGVDMTEAMIDRSRRAAREAGLDNVEVRQGDVHALPMEDASVDVVISNGVLNLAYDKPRAFGEIARVLRPGGRLQLADIVVGGPLSDRIRSDYELWAA